MKTKITKKKTLRYFWQVALYQKVIYDGEVYVKVSSTEVMTEKGQRVKLAASTLLEVA